jgi:hypothetical protein
MAKFQDSEDIEGAVLLSCMEALNEIDAMAMQRVVRYLTERCLVRLKQERDTINKSIEYVKREMIKQDNPRLAAKYETVEG